MKLEVLILPVREVLQPNYTNPEFSCTPVSSPPRFRLLLQRKGSFSRLESHNPR
ncbi:hypothetical protein CPC08DRAFT_708659 [Agrocybe pediades]|nr:hypothetical protein CPC08DRAFT_708659 [Agrocybe pediades]